MSDQLANLLASRFIKRTDVKAIQHRDGSWSPHTVTGKHDGERIKWRREDLQAHLTGDRTFGHYLLDTDSQCKLFAFDVDLEKTGSYEANHFVTDKQTADEWIEITDLRAAWLDRAHPARPYLKMQFRVMAHRLMRGIYSTLGIPCAAAYSGGKGIHVYAFTGPISATEAREGAQLVLESLGGFEATKGQNFFKDLNEFPNLSIEVFPKQGSLDGKDLGNLMRMPLGRNLKSTDPTFFIDMTSPLTELVPVDPVWALTTGNPWIRQGE